VELTTVILNVGDPAGLARTRRWYEAHLGLAVDSEAVDHSIWYRVGALRLGLHVGTPLANPENVCLTFEVPDVDELYDQLRETGIEFDGEPTDKQWGARAVTTYDPIGHMITLATPQGDERV
jgi:catechol 2,3-dioxygenase-like lactoylglutathione lyase family enzyme